MEKGCTLYQTAGLLMGLGLGAVVSMPWGHERTAIDAFNSKAVFQTEDKTGLCLRDMNKPDAPTVACVKLPAPQ